MDARSQETASPAEQRNLDQADFDESEFERPGFDRADLELSDWDALSTTSPNLAHLGTAIQGHERSAMTKALGWSRQWFWLLMDRARQMRERRNLTPEAALGRRGEDLAHRYLRARGLTIITRNFTLPNRSGEIDIVARDGPVTVFVEVKSRVTDQFGAPDRAVGPDKQERITRAADYYCYRSGVEWDQVRFDVVSIVFGDKPKVSHTVDAFFLRRTR